MKTNESKNKILIDIITIVLLLAAFIFAYVMGFVNVNSTTGEYFLSTPIMALIAVGGLGILYFSGSVVELVSRIKRDRMNIGFVVSFSLATVCYAALAAIMLALLCKLTDVSSFLPRFIYIVSVLVIIGGYYGSVVYSAKLESEIAELDADSEEEETAAEEE